MLLRNAQATEIDRLARIWYDGWHDAHARILPEELAQLRTFDSFAERLRDAFADMRVAEVSGNAVGFCMVKGEELHQLFVAAGARGSGIAAALVADAEGRLAEAGVASAWLACAIGNDRAARFYGKCGWRRTGTMLNRLPTPAGLFQLEVWRFEKQLTVRRDERGPRFQ